MSQQKEWIEWRERPAEAKMMCLAKSRRPADLPILVRRRLGALRVSLLSRMLPADCLLIGGTSSSGLVVCHQFSQVQLSLDRISWISSSTQSQCVTKSPRPSCSHRLLTFDELPPLITGAILCPSDLQINATSSQCACVHLFVFEYSHTIWRITAQ